MKNADAMPTKDFFVRMVTRDISLEDCILDLIDNCLDGARRTLAASGKSQDSYRGFQASLAISENEFRLEDNCGGISVSDATDYAFHFGRRADAPSDVASSIGLYGIGMKRAVLKMGRLIEIHSSTTTEAFLCKIPVDEWLKHSEWEFEMIPADQLTEAGTFIRIQALYSEITAEFADPTFVNKLSRIIARDYAIFLAKGFAIVVNGANIRAYDFEVKQSEEFKPYRKAFLDGAVEVEVIAGMSSPPPSDLEPSAFTDADYFGWYVLCNDRVVLAADKTDRTVWGDEGFPRWHPQYNGFTGLLIFRSKDPNLLPWTTTKRNVDESSALYRRAVSEMKAATRAWLEYTNQRKNALDEARVIEQRAVAVSVFDTPLNARFVVPVAPDTPRVRMGSIQFLKPLADIKRAAKALGNSSMSNRDVGARAFDYYLKNEVEGEG